MDISEEEVVNELVPIVESYLNETLEIVSLKDSMHHLGYTSLVLKHQQNYSLQYGFQQYALEPVSYTHLDVYKRQILHFELKQLKK